MKLNKTMKKILAFVLSLAMVVSSFGLNVVSAADEWVSTENGWINLEEEGYNRVDEGGNRYAVEGISAVYAGHWAGEADIDILRNTEDPYTMTIDVKSRGNKADWIIQVAYSVRNLDSSKIYTVDLKIDDKVASTKTVDGKETSNEIINLGQSDDLEVGQHTLTVVATELVKGDEPVVVQPITITPNEAKIAETRKIWANWTNPEGTAKAYAYLEEVKEENGVCTAGKGWIFNNAAVQPMTTVDNVARTQGDTDTITVEPGKTYKFIVVSYTAFGDKNGEGSIDITIPSKTQEEIDAENKIAELKAKVISDDNIAKGKAAFALSRETQINNITDGNNDSRWQAEKDVDNEVFGVNLGEVKTISSVIVNWEASNAIAYDIYVAGADGVYGDTPVASVSGLANNKDAIVETTFEATEAQYVKVVVTEWSQNATAYGICVYEFGVFAESAGEETTEAPTEESTEAPTEESTEAPTDESTEAPTQAPTEESTEAPTEAPTEESTEAPTEAPTDESTQAPTEESTEAPTDESTEAPTEESTEAPTQVEDEYADLTFYQVGEKDYYVAAVHGEVKDAFPFQAINDLGDRIEIIPQIAGGEAPIWPDFTDATLNGNDINQIAGAGIYINYSDLTMDAYNVYEATSAVKNDRFQIIIKAGDPSKKDDETTEAPTEAPTDAPIDVPAAVEGLINSTNDGLLPFNFVWNASEGADSYNIYIDGEMIANTVVTSYDAAEYFADAEEGEYSIGVTAVKGDKESAPTEIVFVYGNVDETTEEELDLEIVNPTFDEEGSYLNGWTGSKSTVSVEEDIWNVAVENSGNSEGDNSMWAIQVKSNYIKVPVSKPVTFTAVLLSDEDKEVFVKVTDENENDIATIRVSLKKDVPQEIELPFESEVEDIRVIYALGTMGTEAPKQNFNVTIVGNEFAYEAVEAPTEAPTQAPTEAPTEAPTQAPTQAPTEAPTDASTQAPTTSTNTVAPSTGAPAKVTAPGKASIKKIYKKKKSSKNLKLKIKAVKGAKGYQVAVYKTSKNAKKNKKALFKKDTKKLTYTVKSSKIKNKKTLYVKVRAYVLDAKGNRVYGKWSSAKKVKAK